MSEANIKRSIWRYLNGIQEKGIGYFFPYNPYYGRSGIPDIIGTYCGSPVAFEVKQPKKNITKIQVATIKDMKRGGWAVFIVHSREEVEMIINNIFSTEQKVMEYYNKIIKE